ncbi:MAG: hypothetical protein IK114_06285 [Fibrobacter sp.]|nr:hypothetical protein [Fibrobacter sp.]
MKGVLLLMVWMASLALAMDFPGEFVQNPGGSLALAGLPGYRSSPARYLGEGEIAGFGLAYARVPEASLQVAGAAGEMGLGHFRIAFLGSYAEMDTLYRQVYSEVETAVAHSWIVGGLGYGVSVDILPGQESWTCNRYKAGLALMKKPLSISGLGSLVNQGSFFHVDYGASLRFDGARFGAFVEYDGESFDVGNYLKFEHLSVISAYRFPEFAVSVSLVLSIGNWAVSGAYGSAYPIWDWFGFTVAKSVRKKTIL